MASSVDASPPRCSEKHSKQTQDPTASSQLTGRTKASLSHDAVGGRGACAHDAHAQAQAPLIGAAAREFVPGIGDVPVVDPAKEALDQERRNIADDVCTTTMMMMVVTKTMMRTTMRSSHFFHVAYPFWHLLTKGEC